MNAKKRPGRARNKSGLKSLRFSTSPEIADMARADARGFNKSLDSVCGLILKTHFALKREERGKFYASLPAKRMGRKVVA